MSGKSFSLHELCEKTGVTPSVIRVYIEREWIIPGHAIPAEFRSEKIPEDAYDAEDLARVRLIHELQADFGANDESVPLILHLLDQLCYLRARIRHHDRS